MLRADGHEITVFEKFDTPRPLGAGLLLQPTGLAVLACLGLDGGAIAAKVLTGTMTGPFSGLEPGDWAASYRVSRKAGIRN